MLIAYHCNMELIILNVSTTWKLMKNIFVRVHIIATEQYLDIELIILIFVLFN